MGTPHDNKVWPEEARKAFDEEFNSDDAREAQMLAEWDNPRHYTSPASQHLNPPSDPDAIRWATLIFRLGYLQDASEDPQLQRWTAEWQDYLREKTQTLDGEFFRDYARTLDMIDRGLARCPESDNGKVWRAFMDHWQAHEMMPYKAQLRSEVDKRYYSHLDGGMDKKNFSTALKELGMRSLPR